MFHSWTGVEDGFSVVTIRRFLMSVQCVCWWQVPNCEREYNPPANLYLCERTSLQRFAAETRVPKNCQCTFSILNLCLTDVVGSAGFGNCDQCDSSHHFSIESRPLNGCIVDFIQVGHLGLCMCVRVLVCGFVCVRANAPLLFSICVLPTS